MIIIILNYIFATQKIIMIKVTVKENEDINRALKRFKKKFDKAQVLRQYKNKSFFTKPSITRREEVLKASYKQRLQSKEQ